MSAKKKSATHAKGERSTFTRPKQATRLQPRVKRARVGSKKKS